GGDGLGQRGGGSLAVAHHQAGHVPFTRSFSHATPSRPAMPPDAAPQAWAGRPGTTRVGPSRAWRSPGRWARRAGEHLVDPDGEAVSAHDHHRQQRKQDHGDEQEQEQFPSLPALAGTRVQTTPLLAGAGPSLPFPAPESKRRRDAARPRLRRARSGRRARRRQSRLKARAASSNEYRRAWWSKMFAVSMSSSGR